MRKHTTHSRRTSVSTSRVCAEPWVSGCPGCPVPVPVVSGECPVSVRYTVRSLSGTLSEIVTEFVRECPNLCPRCPVTSGRDRVRRCPKMSGLVSDMCPMVSDVEAVSGAVRQCPLQSNGVRCSPVQYAAVPYARSSECTPKLTDLVQEGV